MSKSQRKKKHIKDKKIAFYLDLWNCKYMSINYAKLERSRCILKDIASSKYFYNAIICKNNLDR